MLITHEGQGFTHEMVDLEELILFVNSYSGMRNNFISEMSKADLESICRS